MGFVTARYYDLVPVLNSGVMFLTLEKGVSPRAGVDKWKVSLYFHLLRAWDAERP